MIAHHCSVLVVGEMYADRDDCIVITLSRRARFRGGDASTITPASERAPAPDAALIKAVARAYRWKELLISGEVNSVDALAKRFGLERRHAGRILSLTSLSPDITRAILQGRQPPGLRLAHLLDADLPLSWTEQAAFLEQNYG